MRRSPSYTVGILLLIAAIAGLIISVAGIIGVWRIEAGMKAGLANTTGMLETTLQATADGLEIARQSLTQADSSLDTLAETVDTAGQSLGDTAPLIESLTQVTSNDLPETIRTTQGALVSAQASAETIDSTLRLITSIPLLPIQPYQPEVPLGQALQDVSASLDAIPESLASMEEALGNTADNLVTIEQQLDDIALGVAGVSASLAGAQDVLTQYTRVVATMQQQLATARAVLPRQLDAIAWFVTVLLVWLGMSQLGLLVQAFDLLGVDWLRRRRGEEEPTAPAPVSNLKGEGGED
jgi:hypothetical protein